MKTIQSYPETMKTADKYLLTMSPETQKMKDAVDSRLEIKAWCLYEDTNKDGELQEILAVLTPENETFATNSQTFIRDFLRMVDLFNESGETVDAIKVVTGTSKAGRQFITCTIA